VPSTSSSNPASTNHISSSHTPPSVSGKNTVYLNTVLSCSLNAQINHWLIDSGANEHICSSLNLLHSFHKIKPMNVILPNGTSVIVHYTGTAVFSPTFHITNVLYSPHFKVNLISVSKLIHVLSYQVNFVLDKCVIQDMKSQKMIGLGSLCDGLYRLDTASCSQESAVSSSTSHKSSSRSHVSSSTCNSICSNVVISCIPSTAIWHFRLGHLSNQRLSKMHQLYSLISVDNKATCDVCHFAKQRKLPFNSSHSIAKSKFEVLHFDI